METGNKVAMKTIHVKYLGPTNTRGSRLKATDGDNSATVAVDHSLSDEDNYSAAAVALCKRLNWDTSKTPLVGGWTKGGAVFVFDAGQRA